MQSRRNSGVLAAWLLMGLLCLSVGFTAGVWSAPVISFGIDGAGNLDVNGVESNTLRVAALTSGRIPISGTNGLIGDDADLRWVGGDTLTVANISAASNYVTTAYILGLTAGRVPLIGVGGLIGTDSDLTFTGDTLTTTKISTGQITDTGLTATRIPIIGAGGLLGDDSSLTYNATTNTLTVEQLNASTVNIENATIENCNINTALIGSLTVDQYIRIIINEDKLLTLTLAQTGNGTVVKNPSKATYDAGETVTITSTADAGYQFYSYDDTSNHFDVIPAKDPESSVFILTMSENCTVTANFAYLVNGTTIDAAHLGYPSRAGGLLFTTDYDGDAPSAVGAAHPNAKYFIRGPGFTTDYPIAVLTHDNPVVRNCVFDDGTPVPGATSLTIMVRGASELRNCTLNNSHKYGIGITSGHNFYVGGCSVTWAQYCYSGNLNGTDGVFEWNTGEGMGLTGMKFKDMSNVTFRFNTIDLTPNNYWTTGQSKQGVNFSDDTALMSNNVVANNTFIRTAAGAYPTIYTSGISIDSGCSSVNTITGNLFQGLSTGAAFYDAFIYGDNFVITGNTFNYCYADDPIEVEAGATGNTVTPNTITNNRG
jgi:hypothetical protein